MQIYHTLAAQNMRRSVRASARPEFNGVIWITLPVRRYGDQPKAALIGRLLRP